MKKYENTENNDYEKDVIDLYAKSKENYKEDSTGEDKKDSSKKEP